MRILFAVLSPISAELGASQMALNLSGALAKLGIEVVVWTPHPIPPEVRSWRRISWIRRRIAEYVRQDGKFDVVDVPPIAVTKPLAQQCCVIARSLQPELAYLWTETRYAGRRHPLGLAIWMLTAMINFYYAALVLVGWARARHILCLGLLEYEWMCRWFPWWRAKTGMYVNAIGDQERVELAEVRRNRKLSAHAGTRFLWLGRWSAHKGPDVLLDFLSERMVQHPEDICTIAGCGDGIAKHLPASLLRAEKIHLVPTYARRDLPKLLADHDAGLFTSRFEGWGLSLQEMLESGMPVYATKAGAVTDLRPEFPESIREFPPIFGERIEVPVPTRLSQEYLARFSWAAIAANYLERIREKA